VAQGAFFPGRFIDLGLFSVCSCSGLLLRGGALCTRLCSKFCLEQQMVSRHAHLARVLLHFHI
jgi:hypothetical protein